MTKARRRTERDDDEDRDMVLCQFMEACPTPSAAQVSEWSQRHRRHADAINKLAGDMLMNQAFPPLEAPEPSQAELAQWEREASAMAASITGFTPSEVTFAELVDAAGMDVPRLADTLDVDRVLLADIEEGSVALPIGRKLIAALAKTLAKPIELVNDAIINAALSPRMAYAKADGPPSSRKVTYRQAILEGDMSDERKAFWLED